MKSTLSSFLIYSLGIFGLILMFAGYISTLGQLGLMGPTSYRTIEPGDLYSGLEYALLLILLPSFLVKATLGKKISAFNFSGGLIIFMFIFAAFFGTLAQIGKTYNYLVYKDESITKIYKDIDIQYEKKLELVSQLSDAVKMYTTHESTVIETITSARKSYISTNDVNTKISAANSLDNALKSINISIENYPDLKASKTVEKYMDELIALEDDLAESKNQYNTAAMEYNSKYKEFPTVIIARLLGFQSKVYFDTDTSK